MMVRESENESQQTLCRLLGVSRQAYHKRKSRAESIAASAEMVIQEVVRIRSVQKRVGSRKLHHLLAGFRAGHSIKMGRDRLNEVLKDHSMQIRKRRRKAPRTTFSSPWRRYPNLIRDMIGDMGPTRANQVWVSDITYVRVGEGFAYLSLITDAYSRKIVGYHLSRDLSAKGCVAALRMAMRDNPEREGLIHHSDRGLQYYSSAYVKLLAKTRISMTEKSDPLENAIAERVNGILKQELLEKRFESYQEARASIDEAVDIYNNLRPHLSIDMLTPAEAHTRTGTLKRLWKNYFSIRPVAQAAAYAAA